jgi:hypothetical protein
MAAAAAGILKIIDGRMGDNLLDGPPAAGDSREPHVISCWSFSFFSAAAGRFVLFSQEKKFMAFLFTSN